MASSPASNRLQPKHMTLNSRGKTNAGHGSQNQKSESCMVAALQEGLTSGAIHSLPKLRTLTPQQWKAWGVLSIRTIATIVDHVSQISVASIFAFACMLVCMYDPMRRLVRIMPQCRRAVILF